MSSRLDLHEILKGFTNNVYYQPPSTIKMKYPAIVYARESIENTFANDSVYAQSHFYQITVIDEDPDSGIVKGISRLPKCRYNRHYTSDNLNHDVFTIYY